jgi:hypothetical protein|tara:strand:- start:1151 stop:2131 length:981 start_codon:yes stop_codon:yes gene_type:complete
MGILKKAFKGLKKVVKKIGKGIKKVVGKIGKAFGKLGIVGQLGMMFLMPYAMSGLSSFMGGIGSRFGSFAANLAGSSNAFMSSVGKAMQGIHAAGSTIGNAYSTITEAIGNGLDRAGNFLKGEGFTLSEGRTSVFAPKEIPEVDLTKVTEATIPDVETGVPARTTTEDRLRAAATSSPTDTVTDGVVDDVVTETTKPNLLDRAKDYVGEAFEGVKAGLSDPKTIAETGLKKAAISRVTYAAAGDPPSMTQYSVGIDLPSLSQFASTGVFNEQDFSKINSNYLQGGSSFGGTSLAHVPYLETLANVDRDVNHTRKVAMLNPVLNFGG